MAKPASHPSGEMLPLLVALLVPRSDALLQRMLATERAFSKTCGIAGLRDSFLRFFAPDGLMFIPEPVNARSELMKQPAPKGTPRAVLSWWPTHGDIALSGDLGYSTGPYCLTDSASGKRTWNGAFFSIWQRQADGQYRVVVDRGVALSEPRPADGAPTRFEPADSFASRAWTGPLPDGAEAAFLKRAKSQGYSAALRASAAKGLRVYRPGTPPMPLPAPPESVRLETWQPVKNGVSQANDFAYFVGTYSAERAKGVYVHVWRRDDSGRWRMAIDILHPNP